jgi:hypothetical protein
MQVKLMIVPGKTFDLNVPEGSTVVGVCSKIPPQNPPIDAVDLAKGRQVRVSGQVFSNNKSFDPKEFGGSIFETPLSEGAQIMILTKITGNGNPIEILKITINGEGYNLDRPMIVGEVLRELRGVSDLDRVSEATINGLPTDRYGAVKDGDQIVYRLEDAPSVAVIPETSCSDSSSAVTSDGDDDEETFEVELDGEWYDSKLEAIRAIIDMSGSSDDDQQALLEITSVLERFGL